MFELGVLAPGGGSDLPAEKARRFECINTREATVVSLHSLWHCVLRRNAPKNLVSFQLSKILGEAAGWVCHKRPFLASV